jgi:hypothetical protein
MAKNRISKTPERNCQKMTITRQAKIQKKREQNERKRVRNGTSASYVPPVPEKKSSH